LARAFARALKVTRAPQGWSLQNLEPIYFQVPKGELCDWFVVVGDETGVKYFGALNPAAGGCVAEETIRINTEALTLLRRRPI